MTDLEKKVLAHLNTAAGKKKIKEAIDVDIKREAKKLVNAVRDVQSELPFDFGVSAGPVEITMSNSGDMVVGCDVDFNHDDAIRDAFSPNGRDPDLIYLFNNGYSYDKEPPQGVWHGHWTVAWAQREGLHFVEKAVDNYLSSAPSGVEVEIDDSYV